MMTIGELEASYPLYCRALRLLIQEGKSLKKVQRTVCWSRLESLHGSLPRQYRDPEHLYFLLKRQVEFHKNSPSAVSPQPPLR
jgi:hypothetical protein